MPLSMIIMVSMTAASAIARLARRGSFMSLVLVKQTARARGVARCARRRGVWGGISARCAFTCQQPQPPYDAVNTNRQRREDWWHA